MRAPQLYVLVLQLLGIQGRSFAVAMSASSNRVPPPAASGSGAPQPVATVSGDSVLRVASDGEEYNWEEWCERYGREWAGVLWPTANVPLHVAPDGGAYTWEEYMWYYGENAPKMWNLPGRRLQLPFDWQFPEWQRAVVADALPAGFDRTGIDCLQPGVQETALTFELGESVINITTHLPV